MRSNAYGTVSLDLCNGRILASVSTNLACICFEKLTSLFQAKKILICAGDDFHPMKSLFTDECRSESRKHLHCKILPAEKFVGR